MSEPFLYPQLFDASIIDSGKNALQFLSWFKKQLDSFLTAYFDEKIKQVSQIHPETVALVEEVRRFVQDGGKKVRPAFTYAGYTACGGRSHEAIIYAASSLELLHCFALIHDDIMDNANLRRGRPSVHYAFSDFHRKRGFFGSASEFGTAAAILAGDLAAAYAGELLNTAPFPSERIRRAKVYFDAMFQQVTLGQYLDVTASARKIITEKELMALLEYKTAKYTVERPLQIGAALAGSDEESLQEFSRYGVPLGQAFQIQDDILGTFSNEEKIGKPVDSDLKEGKWTMLIAKSLELAKPAEKKNLLTVVGNKNASADELETAREIIINSGALDYAKKLSSKLIERAKESIIDAKLESVGKDYLIGAADYLLTRQM